jgi:hypothetical protein
MDAAKRREELEALSIEERRRVIAQDVASGKDRYRPIEVFDLAEALHVPLPPDGSWDYCYRKQIIETFDECWNNHGHPDDLAEALLDVDANEVLDLCRDDLKLSTECVSNSDYEEIAKRLANQGERARRELSEHQKEAVRLALAQKQFEANSWNGLGSSTVYKIDTEDGALVFDATLEDDGSCIEIDSPYENRDAERAGAGSPRPFFYESW